MASIKRNPKRVAAGKQNYLRKLELQRERREAGMEERSEGETCRSLDLESLIEHFEEQGEKVIEQIEEEKKETGFQNYATYFLWSCISSIVGTYFVEKCFKQS